MTPDSRWELAADPAEVHALLCASDAYQAAATGTPVPRRRLETATRHVAAGNTWLLRQGSTAAAMFTLTSDPPYDLAETGFPAADHPVYLQRLAVLPELVAAGSLAGVRCVRKAIDVARETGDVLRSEANPDLAGTRELLQQCGFRQIGDVHANGTGRRWIYLQKDLTG